MEIKISKETLVKILWIVSVVFGAIGFVTLLYGVISIIFVVDDVEEGLVSVGLVVGGIAFAVIPHSLASSVTNLMSAIGQDTEEES